MAVRLADEVWMARRLRRRDLFAGVTTAIERRERVAAAIQSQGFELVAAGRREGSRVTWAELFTEVYGQHLPAPPPP